jgi:hypothetical protein
MARKAGGFQQIPFALWGGHFIGHPRQFWNHCLATIRIADSIPDPRRWELPVSVGQRQSGSPASVSPILHINPWLGIRFHGSAESSCRTGAAGKARWEPEPADH